MKKRILSLALALMMCLTLLPVSVFAAESDFIIGGDGALYVYNGPGGDVVIPDGVTSIGVRVFYGVDLTSVTIPNGVTSIGEGAFYGCTGLTSVTIPDSVTSIDENAFYDCSGLTQVKIPDSVATIGRNAFFGTPWLTAQGGVMVWNGALISYELENYGAGQTVVIPEGVTSVEYMLFADAGITGLIIPDGVTSIGDGAFMWCENLTSVTFPASLTSIGSGGFMSSGLTSATFLNGNTEIGYEAFENQSYSWSDGDGTEFIGGGGPLENLTIYAPAGGKVEEYCKESGVKFVAKEPTVGGFTDVPAGEWYAKAVIWAVEQNITQGTGGGKFSPKQQCTQAEIITFLWRAAGEPKPAATVTSTEFYAQAVQWAKEKGIIDSSFELFKYCTRKTAVTYMWKYAGSPTGAPAASFPDVPAGSDFAKAVAWALQQKVTEGTDQGLFLPEAVCDRGQIVTFLYRAFA